MRGGGGRGGKATERDFHGERRKNDTHASTTDPESRLFRKGKGKEAKLCFMGHVVTENRHGLVVAAKTTLATGTAEREASVAMMKGVREVVDRPRVETRATTRRIMFGNFGS